MNDKQTDKVSYRVQMFRHYKIEKERICEKSQKMKEFLQTIIMYIEA